jgi:hypothetical protein
VVFRVDGNSCAACTSKCDSRWIQSKEINRFATVFQPFEDWQEPNDLPKYLPKYHSVRQSSNKRNIILKLMTIYVAAIEAYFFFQICQRY